MFEKLLKNRTEAGLLVGNIVVFLLITGSFVWFLLFALRTIDQTLNVKIGSSVSQELRFHTDEFEKLTVLFDRTDVGFSQLHEEEKKP